MNNFIEIDTLPVYDLKSELITMLNDGKIYWSKHNQICINSLPTDPDNFLAGCGSLQYNWSDEPVITQDGSEKYILEKIATPKKEIDFSVLCSAFKGTLFEDIYNKLTSQYCVGRIRLMKSKPKTCLSWHTDSSPRIHYPLKTQEGCFMVINDEIKHMELNTWYWTKTTQPHTAFNASKEDRIHLVVSILGDEYVDKF
jgi:hypothetical protein|tara:strand:+ start:319 stop:912 length:594 start_codon:yes stop_codon:yes gene_type:complete